MEIDSGNENWPPILNEDVNTAKDGTELNRFVRPLAPSSDPATVGKYQLSNKTFTQQFATMYYLRMNQLRSRVERQAKKKWPGVPLLKKTLNLTKNVGECVIIGTIYKDMKLKPCILDEYDDEEQGVKKDKKVEIVKDSQYISDDDVLIIEDEYGRVKLVLLQGSTVNVSAMVTGLVVAVKGKESADGSALDVNDIVYPELPTQTPLPTPTSPAKYALLVSDLSVGDPSNNPLHMQLLVDYVTGFLGGNKDITLCSSIERVIVCGNSLHRINVDVDADFRKISGTKTELTGQLEELDLLLTQIAASVQVDLMPGENDPSNFTLPQQPLHPCLFASTRTYSSFALHTNPIELVTGPCRILGTSGQNIQDLAQYCTGSRLELLERTLKWGIIAPTAPDTLGCYPFQEEDAFVLKEKECPHVYFSANESEYATKIVEGDNGQKTRLILVPSFKSTHTAVLLNLHDLTTVPVSFDVDSDLVDE